MQDLVDDDVAVDGVGQRLANAHVLQRLRPLRLIQVEHVDVGTGLRDRDGLIGVFRLQARILAGGDFHAVQLARQIAGQRGVLIVDGQRGDGLDDGVFVVPVVRVRLHHHLFAQHMFLEDIGAVADQRPGLRPFVAIRLDHLLVDREGGGMGQHFREVGQGRVDRHLERVVIDGLHAQIVDRHFARDDGGGVLDLHQLDIPGVFRGSRRIGEAFPGIDEVLRGDRVAIRPLGVVAQVEGIDGLVLGQIVAQRDAGDEGAGLIFIVKPFEERAQHAGAFDIGVDLRVHRLDRVKQPVGVILIVGQRVAGCDVGGKRRKRKAKAERGGQKKLVDDHVHTPVKKVGSVWMSAFARAEPAWSLAASGPLARQMRQAVAGTLRQPDGETGHSDGWGPGCGISAGSGRVNFVDRCPVSATLRRAEVGRQSA